MATSHRAGMVLMLFAFHSLLASSAPFPQEWPQWGTSAGSPSPIGETGVFPGAPTGSTTSPPTGMPTGMPDGSWTGTPGGSWTGMPTGMPTGPPTGVSTDDAIPTTSTWYSTVTAAESAPWTSTTAPLTTVPSSSTSTTSVDIPTTPSADPTSSTETTPAVAPTATPNTTPATGTLPLTFYNNMRVDQVYAYLTGLDINGQTVMLTQDGQWYYPVGSSETSEPIPSSANVALSLNGYKQTTQITIPSYVTSARLWVSQDHPLQFGMTTSGLVEPSAANDQDPNYNTNWGFMELTFNSAEDGGLYTNLSFVDFIGLPLGMQVLGPGNSTQSALGPHKASKEEVCGRLQQQAQNDGQPWDQLCKNDTSSSIVRVVSPQTYVGQNASAFGSYFDDYVDAVYQQYATTPLVIQTQSSSTGTINCTASSDYSQLVCDGDDTPFTKPSTQDIFTCSTGPFANAGNPVHLAALPRVCAAFNRATLHLPGGNVQPHLPPSRYYLTAATNFYSRFVHDAELDGKGYAFSYDDVSPDMAVWNTAGLISEPSPTGMNIFVGGFDKKVEGNLQP